MSTRVDEPTRRSQISDTGFRRFREHGIGWRENNMEVKMCNIIRIFMIGERRSLLSTINLGIVYD